MDVRTGPKHRDTGPGFTLVELLLAVSLVLLLLGAVVFNFSSLHQGAQLDEGINQFEALIRFARAQAAHTGRQVQITFEEDLGDGMFIPMGNVSVIWEPDPIARPGVFQPLIEAGEYVRGITDLVRVESVHLIEGNNFDQEPANPSRTADEGADGDSLVAAFPPIGFFPDGSSDSAEIILASRGEEDHRHVAVRLQGITGLLRRKWIADEPKTDGSEQPRPADAVPNPPNANPISDPP
jgi:type II secretory pathway pseudopilin PulG